MKVAPHDVAERDKARERFLREASIQSRLAHPSIVPVYDLEVRPDGSVFFTMQHVDGRTLRDVINAQIIAAYGADAASTSDVEGRLSRTSEVHVKRTPSGIVANPRSLRRTLGIFGEICRAIAFAHAHKIVHLDLKPENIMLGDLGEVFVLDWGVATSVKPGEPPRPRPATPGYAAPEQLKSATCVVDERTDVYSLGAILFELLTLAPLHCADSAEQVVASTLAGVDARPTGRIPHAALPAEVDQLCTKATSLDPHQRYSNAQELSEEVERILDEYRDIEQRQRIAARHIARAEQYLLATSAGKPADHGQRHKQALSELGLALASDADSDAAHALLRRVIKASRDEIRLRLSRPTPAAHRLWWQCAARASAAVAAIACLAMTAPNGLAIPLAALTWVTVELVLALRRTRRELAKRRAERDSLALLATYTSRLLPTRTRRTIAEGTG